MGYQYWEYDGSRTDDDEGNNEASSEPKPETKSLGEILRRVNFLEKELGATNRVSVGGWEEDTGSHHRDGPIIHPGTIIDEPDVDRRGKARVELDSLRKEPKQLPIVSYAVNRALGEKVDNNFKYSLRIALHQHPVAIAFGVVATSGLGYMLYQYLSR